MKIPLKVGTKIVAVVTFKGRGPITAQGTITAVEGGKERASQARELVKLSRGMARSDTSSPVGAVKYWGGFWGWLSGLDVVLPSIGMSVDWDGVEYP